MFFERSASRFVIPSISFSASIVIEVSGIGVHLVRVERAVLERVAVVAGLLQVAVGERVLVDDEDPARRQVLEVRLQRRRVHGDEDVRRVAGVRMSWSAKWSWKPETPGSEPAGAGSRPGSPGTWPGRCPAGRLGGEAARR
jgi:hypothetical protein